MNCDFSGNSYFGETITPTFWDSSAMYYEFAKYCESKNFEIHNDIMNLASLCCNIGSAISANLPEYPDILEQFRELQFKTSEKYLKLMHSQPNGEHINKEICELVMNVYRKRCELRS